MPLVVAGRADGAQVRFVVAAAVTPFDDMICNGCPARAAHELQLAHVAIALEHAGSHRTPWLRVIEAVPRVVLTHRLTGVPPDRLMHRRSHEELRGTPQGRAKLGFAGWPGIEFLDYVYLKRLAGPTVKEIDRDATDPAVAAAAESSCWTRCG